MKLYRYMKRAHAELAKEGRFRLGRLLKYQLIECVTGDDSIGDSHEGLSRTILTATVKGADQQGELKNLTGIGVAGEGTVKFNNVRLIDLMDFYVLCCTMHSPDDAPNLDGGYDACVKITNDQEFFQTLYQNGVEARTGRAICELFPSAACGIVSYDWAEGSYSNGLITSPDPFLKRPQYRDQAEVRFVLEPASQWAWQEDDLDILCKEASEYVEVSEIEPTPLGVQKTANFPPSLPAEDCKVKLRLLYEKYSEEMHALVDSGGVRPVAEEQGAIYIAWEADFDRRHRHEVIRLLYQLREWQPDLSIDRKIAMGLQASMLLQSWHSREMRSFYSK